MDDIEFSFVLFWRSHGSIRTIPYRSTFLSVRDKWEVSVTVNIVMDVLDTASLSKRLFGLSCFGVLEASIVTFFFVSLNGSIPGWLGVPGLEGWEL
jgi:hypothetical protein